MKEYKKKVSIRCTAREISRADMFCDGRNQTLGSGSEQTTVSLCRLIPEEPGLTRFGFDSRRKTEMMRVVRWEFINCNSTTTLDRERRPRGLLLRPVPQVDSNRVRSAQQTFPLLKHLPRRCT